MSSTYAQFIAANNALFACMEAVPAETYQAMNAAEQSSVCKSEAAAVSNFLRNDSVHFRSLIQDRISALNAAQQQ